MRRVFPRGTRRLVTCHARAVMAGRVFANGRMRGMLCGAGLDILGSQCASAAKSTVIHAPRFPTAGAREAASNSHRAAMLEISRRHRSCGIGAVCISTRNEAHVTCTDALAELV